MGQRWIGLLLSGLTLFVWVGFGSTAHGAIETTIRCEDQVEIPFPWNAEIPMPWNWVSGVWRFSVHEQNMKVRVQPRTENDAYRVHADLWAETENQDRYLGSFEVRTHTGDRSLVGYVEMERQVFRLEVRAYQIPSCRRASEGMIIRVTLAQLEIVVDQGIYEHLQADQVAEKLASLPMLQ